MLKGNEDITDEEYDKFLMLYIKNFNTYMVKYIIPDVFNGLHGCFEDVLDSTISLLLIKYNLAITTDDPLDFRMWQ